MRKQNLLARNPLGLKPGKKTVPRQMAKPNLRGKIPKRERFKK